MNDLFLVLLLLSLGGLVIGLVKPSVVKQVTRKQVFFKLGGAFVAFFILFGVTSSDAPESTVDQSQANSTATPTAVAQVAATKVDVATFVGEFDKNQLAAEKKWEDTVIQFTGKVKNISEDFTGGAYVVVHPQSADQYYFGTAIQCFFKSQSDLIALENGKVTTFQGKVDSQVLNVIVKECKVITQ